MAKDPAFLFYPKDWLQGTAELLPNEKGVYIDLLCHQHQNGDLPTDTLRLARMVGLGHDEFLKIWEVLKDKFSESNGRFVNNKLIGVIKDRIDRGLKNTITGTFASLLRKAKLTPENYAKIRKEFNIDEFLTESTENPTERLTDWFQTRLESIVNANGDATVNGTKDVIVVVNETEFEKKIKEFYDFRKQLKKPIIESSKQAFLNKLNKLSGGDENTAIEILNESIANGWQGIFELKTNQNGKSTTFKTEREKRGDELTNLKAGSIAFLNRDRSQDPT